MEGQMFFKEEFAKKTIIQLRWTLFITVGYIIVFSPPGKPMPIFLNAFLLIYTLTNLILSFGPEKWFQRQQFISLILLLDLSIMILTIFLAGLEDSEFYVAFFIILLISAITRKAFFVYSTFGIILLAYGVTSYLKSPGAFFETASLLRFPFIFILATFFRGIVVSYNRVYQEKELLKADYQELEVLNSVALSIGQYNDLPPFLFKLSKLLSEKLGIERFTVLFMDRKEDNCYMVSSDDLPGEESHVINLKKYPAFKESLKSEKISQDETLPPPLQETSRYILKKIHIAFKEKKLGTLYLRANTPMRSLTRREEYFLQVLGRITAIAILDVERATVFEELMATRRCSDIPQLVGTHGI
jgi:hypothetical protein